MSKRNIQFAAPEEPAFLKKLKSKIGYKKNYDNIETKAQKLQRENVLHDRDEEEPVYVLEEESRISERELDTFKTKLKNEREAVEQDVKDAKEASKQTRIIFQKPMKKKDDNDGMQSFQGTSIKKTPDNKNDALKNSRKYVKSIKNTNLLSFGDDDEDEEEGDA